jgi:Asp-tRNA(Asn)/Glu-tRNA(Gln) amidotransferase A subunit family amidase
MENSSMPSDLLSLTATRAVRLIHGGKLRPEALMEAYLDRIAGRDPTVRAFAHFDPAQARAAAASACSGPLRGIPIGVKDVLDIADMPSQYGSPIWANWRPKADSVAVAWPAPPAALRSVRPSPPICLTSPLRNSVFSWMGSG